ncbi:MAG: DUF6240 domain-containing protein [Lachnospiraceae bacterium]|jgi:hypothetical protein|nr:DUF6240 domain-containing protein [Lachnospiraceae bacterium]
MKITNESPESIRTHSPNIGNDTTVYSHSASPSTGGQNGFALDISGTVMDNTAYGGHGRTTEDVMQEIGQEDITTRRNYMAIMSNTMSEEDFAQLQKDGVDPNNTDIETVVTIVDHIKVALLQGGTQVAGYTDDLDARQFEEITGNKALAQELCKQFKAHDLPASEDNIKAASVAWEKAKEINQLSEGSVKYMVENNLAPTVENLYLAQFSGADNADKQGQGYYAQGSGANARYYAKKAENFNWDTLKDQITKTVHEAGYEVKADTISDSKWLIEKGIPFTADNLVTMQELRDLSLPLTPDQAAKAFAASLANGQNPLFANIADPRSYLQRAHAYQQVATAIEPKAVDVVLSEKQGLNLRNLAVAQQRLNKEEAQTKETQADRQPEQKATQGVINIPENTSPEAITAKRQLEEIRLMMTVEANVRLLRSGFALETASLTQLVDRLKEAESSIKMQLTGAGEAMEADHRYALYRETVTKVGDIAGMPLALIGRMALVDRSDITTLNRIHESGTLLRLAYEKAGETYEAIKTAPRKDMGDSIRKAFRNVDDILNESGLETSERNRRAVRILGYNSMEITTENIAEVAKKDNLLQEVIERMKPATVLEMIREKINPLTMSMEQLNEYLTDKQSTGSVGSSADNTAEQGSGPSVAASMEDYSRFLYKLEQKDGISATERSAYIGVYRLLRQVEKGDSAVVGAMINAEMEFSMGNLLTAIRSGKKTGREFLVDDNFGGLNAKPNEQNLKNNLNEIMQSLESPETDDAYAAEQAKEVAGLKNNENAVIRSLLDHNQPVTWNMLVAAGKMMKNSGMLFKKADSYAKETGKEERLQEATEQLYEQLTDSESAEKAYRALNETITDIFQGAAAKDEVKALDVRELSGLCRQISFAATLAKEEQYEIPVEIDGEITAINLRVIHGQTGEGGKVSATISTDGLGQVVGEFTISNGVLNGLITGTSPDGLGRLKQSGDFLKQILGGMMNDNHNGIANSNGLKIGTVSFVKNNTGNTANNNINNYKINSSINSSNINKSSTKNSNTNIVTPDNADPTLTEDRDTVSDKELYLVARSFISYIQKVSNQQISQS